MLNSYSQQMSEYNRFGYPVLKCSCELFFYESLFYTTDLKNKCMVFFYDSIVTD